MKFILVAATLIVIFLQSHQHASPNDEISKNGFEPSNNSLFVGHWITGPYKYWDTVFYSYYEFTSDGIVHQGKITYDNFEEYELRELLFLEEISKDVILVYKKDNSGKRIETKLRSLFYYQHEDDSFVSTTEGLDDDFLARNDMSKYKKVIRFDNKLTFGENINNIRSIATAFELKVKGDRSYDPKNK